MRLTPNRHVVSVIWFGRYNRREDALCTVMDSINDKYGEFTIAPSRLLNRFRYAQRDQPELEAKRTSADHTLVCSAEWTLRAEAS